MRVFSYFLQDMDEVGNNGVGFSTFKDAVGIQNNFEKIFVCVIVAVGIEISN